MFTRSRLAIRSEEAAMSSAKPSTRNLELLFMALFRRNPDLNGKEIAQDDRDAPARADCIIVGAEIGDRELDGPNIVVGGKSIDPSVFAFTVTAKYRSTTSSAAQNDAVEQAMLSSVYEAPADCVDELKLFSFLRIESQGTTASAKNQNTKIRSRTFNGYAKSLE